jgi:tRNA-2-methylthio-N6-dimethylallyladenosine synthase
LGKTSNYIDFEKAFAKNIIEDLRTQIKGKRYFLRTYGCQLNENDSEKIAGIFDLCECIPGSDMESSDIIVLNTCTIRENANDKIWGHLGIVHRIKKNNPGLLVVVCGCMMKETHQKEKIVEKFQFVNLVFGPSDIHQLPQLLLEFYQSGKRIFALEGEEVISENIPVQHKKNFRALCTVIYGCNNFCSYCIVPYVRGRERSRKMDDILKEVKQLSLQGFKEILLLGQNVNSYGKDGYRYDFADLLENVSMISGIQRIRFMTSHPRDLSKKMIDVMASIPTIMPHIHLPLQSGSDKILKLMNRGYNKSQYTHIIEYARKMIPNIAITTDIIVGFPGETEEDFIDTLTMMGNIKFDSAFTFQYSERKGTAAVDFDDKVSSEIVKSRFEKLLALQNACSFASNQAIVETNQEVLVEGFSDTDKNMLSGRTPQHRLVNFSILSFENSDDNIPVPEEYEGKFALVEITRAKTFSLEGKLIRWL